MKAYFHFERKQETTILSVGRRRILHMPTMGQRIKTLREKREMTRAQLAAKCRVSEQMVGQWERDVAVGIRPDNMLRLLEALGTTLSHLVRGTATNDEDIGELTQDDIDAILARRAISSTGGDEFLSAMWATVHAYLTMRAPALAKLINARHLSPPLSESAKAPKQSRRRAPSK